VKHPRSGLPPMVLLYNLSYLQLQLLSSVCCAQEDVIYCLPRSENNSLLDLRGAFVTLGQMLTDVTDNSAKK